jgi:branched-chain amino acid transport system permease protein
MQALPLRAVSRTLVLAVPLTIVTLLGVGFASPSTLRVIVSYIISVILVLGFQSFSGNSGIVSFGHVAFMGVGAYVAAIATVPPSTKATDLTGLPSFLEQHSVSFLPAVLLGGAASALLAAVLGIGLMRMREGAMAMATIGVLVIFNVIFVQWDGVTGGTSGIVGVPRTTTAVSALIVAILVIVACRAFQESRRGLQLRASRTEPVAAEAAGVNVVRVRWVAWTLSAAIMGMGGAVWAQYNIAVNPANFFFALTFSLLAMLVVGGLGSVSGAVIGATVLTVVFEATRRVEEAVTVPGLTQIVVAILILLALWRRPDGLMGLSEADDVIGNLRKRLGPKSRTRRAGAKQQQPDTAHLRPTTSAARREAHRAHVGTVSLRLEHVGKRFGGVAALADVSLNIREGEIVGLIGPNGSGKSTLLNLASGVLRPTEGQVIIGDAEATGEQPHAFAGLGIGRTFQQVRLFSDLSVYDNVAVGAVARGESPKIVRDLLRQLDLLKDADRLAVHLSYGAQRRVEIARALAGRPRFLLLDEPAAGMNEPESDALLEMIHAVRRDQGCAVLITDHDLRLMMRLCERLHVLNEGRTISEGVAETVRRDPRVVEAYLGQRAAVEAERSEVPRETNPRVTGTF